MRTGRNEQGSIRLWHLLVVTALAGLATLGWATFGKGHSTGTSAALAAGPAPTAEPTTAAPAPVQAAPPSAPAALSQAATPTTVRRAPTTTAAPQRATQQPTAPTTVRPAAPVPTTAAPAPTPTTAKPTTTTTARVARTYSCSISAPSAWVIGKAQTVSVQIASSPSGSLGDTVGLYDSASSGFANGPRLASGPASSAGSWSASATMPVGSPTGSHWLVATFGAPSYGDFTTCAKAITVAGF